MLVIKRDRIDSTWPLLGLFDPPPLGVDKFDHWNLGTYNSALQAGIAPAIRFHREIGVDAIHGRLQELTRYWIDLASRIPGFRLHTRLDHDELGAVSLFSIDGLDARTVEQRLREVHQVHVKYREVAQLRGMRVSPHIYVRKVELDTFVDALEQVVGDLRPRGSSSRR
jgi:selenocysteine lyase/cysteine desulfurase